MDLEEARHALASYDINKDWPRVVYLSPDLLPGIAADELTPNPIIGVGLPGTRHEEYWPGHNILYYDIEPLWNGVFFRDFDHSFTVIIRHQIWHTRPWSEAIGVPFWLDLLYRSVQSRLDTVPDLRVREPYNWGDFVRGFDYQFTVVGETLQAVFDIAVHTQEDIEAPAQSVLSDMTKVLAASAEKIRRGHYTKVADLIAKVDEAESAADKGASLETLMATLFEQVPGFNVWRRDVHSETEEMDLIVLNDKQYPVFSGDGPIIIVECKNWTTNVL